MTFVIPIDVRNYLTHFLTNNHITHLANEKLELLLDIVEMALYSFMSHYKQWNQHGYTFLTAQMMYCLALINLEHVMRIAVKTF